ncbi:hypothetical protein K7X08_027782 [Anisodus acutangulus]|uniref:Uncharacterized protein n=1 Tax=Anisodus acutangulus TaxID=402998 RepID=A0A9Q1LJI9_9SOLA|nr:hypothetical protein K7X08_027782 [Anisodus acutangulus]
MVGRHEALALGHQESYMLSYNTSQDATASDTEKVLAEKFSHALPVDMPHSSMPIVDPYYPVMDFDMTSSSIFANEVPHYLTTRIVTPEEPFRKFASSEPLSFTGLAQRYGAQINNLPAFARHNSPNREKIEFYQFFHGTIIRSTDRCNDFEENPVLTQLTQIMSNNNVDNDRLDESDSDSLLDHDRTDAEQSSNNIEEGPNDFSFTRDNGPVLLALWDPKNQTLSSQVCYFRTSRK